MCYPIETLLDVTFDGRFLMSCFLGHYNGLQKINSISCGCVPCIVDAGLEAARPLHPDPGRQPEQRDHVFARGRVRTGRPTARRLSGQDLDRQGSRREYRRSSIPLLPPLYCVIRLSDMDLISVGYFWHVLRGFSLRFLSLFCFTSHQIHAWNQ
jgi:hypothetical protein